MKQQKAGSGVVIIMTFLTLTMLFILGMHQWLTVSFTRSRQRARQFTLARLLGESALNEFEAELRARTNTGLGGNPFKRLHDGLEDDAFSFVPQHSLEMATTDFNIPNPFGSDGVLVVTKSHAICPGVPAPNLPDETEGRLTAMVTVEVGSIAIKLARVIEFKQLMMCPPWGFDQTGFAALDWVYYRERFDVFCQKVLRYLRDRQLFIATVEELALLKKDVVLWGWQWTVNVRNAQAACGASEFQLAHQIKQNGERRNSNDRITQNLLMGGSFPWGRPYFEALEKLDEVYPKYDDPVIKEARELPVKPEDMPLFRDGQTGDDGNESFEPWHSGSQIKMHNDYVPRHFSKIFCLPGGDGEWKAPVFTMADACDSKMLEFKNRRVPFEEDPSLLECDDMFRRPPWSKSQIWDFDYSDVTDKFKADDFDPWSLKRDAFANASNAFLSFYEGQIQRHAGLLRIGNSPAFTERYKIARARLSADYQKVRAGYVFPKASYFDTYLYANRLAGGGQAQPLHGACMVEEAVDLSFSRYAGSGFIIAPRIGMVACKASAGPDKEHLVLLATDDKATITVTGGGAVEAGLLVPKGNLASDGKVDIRGTLIVGNIGTGSATALDDAIEPEFSIVREPTFEYVDRNAGSFSASAIKKDHSLVMFEPSPAVQTVMIK